MRNQSKFVIAVLLGHIEASALRQPTGAFESERDAEAGYPSAPFPRGNDTIQAFVDQYVDKKNGAFITQFDVDAKNDAAAEAELERARKENKFNVPSWMTFDRDGDRFITDRPYGYVPGQEKLLEKRIYGRELVQ